MMQGCFDVIQEQLQGSVGCRKAGRGRFYSRKPSQAEPLHFVSMAAQTIKFLPIVSVCLGNGCQRAGFSLNSIWTRARLSSSANTHQITALFLEKQLV